MTAAACQNITKERKGLGLHSATFSEPNTEGKRLRLENKLKKLKNAANCESQVRGILERTEVCPCARPATPAYARLPESNLRVQRQKRQPEDGVEDPAEYQIGRASCRER